MPPVGKVPETMNITSAIQKKSVILYFTNWGVYGRNYQVKDIPVDYITGINYAFFDLRKDSKGNYIPTTGDAWADTDQRYITEDKGLKPLDSWNTDNPFYGNFGQIKKLKDSGKKLSVGLSVGGWTWSKNFSLAMETEDSRQAFVDEIIKLFKTYNIFDRLDIDWEYISPSTVSYGDPGNISKPEDAKNFGLFLKLMRNALDSNGFEKYEISACTTADPKKMNALPIKEMIKYLDTINIMTYDFADGGWGMTTSTHQSNVYKTNYTQFSVQESVEKMLSLGVPNNKIIIGVAYYSRGFSNTAGLAKPASGASTDKSWEAGIVDYKKLPLPGAKEFYDDKAGAGYSYDPVKKIFNSYDTVRSVQEKCKYVKDKNLKGVIVWEASGDVSPSSSRSLTKALYDGLISNKTPISNPTPAPIPVPVVIPKPIPVVPKPVPIVVTPPVKPVPAPISNKNNEWTVNTYYKVGDTVIYKSLEYKCLNPHVAMITWEPDVAVSLWSQVSKVFKEPKPMTLSMESISSTLNEPSSLSEGISSQETCPYLEGRIKTFTISGEISVENIKFNIPE